MILWFYNRTFRTIDSYKKLIAELYIIIHKNHIKSSNHKLYSNVELQNPYEKQQVRRTMQMHIRTLLYHNENSFNYLLIAPICPCSKLDLFFGPSILDLQDVHCSKMCVWRVYCTSLCIQWCLLILAFNFIITKSTVLIVVYYATPYKKPSIEFHPIYVYI